MNRPVAPPRLAEELVRRVTPPAAQSGVLGDLAEEFAERAAGGLQSARVWYWSAALGVAGHYAVDRRRRRRFEHRDNAKGGTGMDGWIRDARYALRRLARSPGFSAVIVVTMAVAIGANAAIFGAVRPVLAPTLPFPDAQRIVRVWEANVERGRTRSSVSWQDARDWNAAARSFDAMAVYNTWEGNLVTEQQAQRIRYTMAEPDFFRVLGVPPLLGRTLVADEIDPSRGDVVILSHGLWTRAFGADPSVLGRSVSLAGRSLEVVGVMPPDFAYPATDVDAWKPWGMAPDDGGTRDSYWTSVIARMAPGVALTEAQQEMTLIGERLEAEHPDTNQGFRPLLEPLGQVAVVGARQGILLLWAAVALLLLVACANVATLLMARGEARTEEMAVRLSLGAGRASLIRQLLMESVITAAMGGVLGVMLAAPATAGVQSLLGARLSYGLGVELDPMVMLYAVLVTGAAGVGFGLLPALRTSGDGQVVSRAGRGAAGGRTGRLGGALVAGQTALAVVILAGAGLLGRTIVGLRSVDPGFDPAGGLTFRVAPPQEGVERAQAAVLLGEIRGRIASLPGVTGVAGINRQPFAGNAWGSEWTDRARLGEPALRAFARVLQPGYLDVLGVPVLQGRGLLSTDDAASEAVAVVSAAAAAQYWPEGDAVGAYVSLAPDDARAPWVRVVGVVGDVEGTSLGAGPASMVYTPFEQSVFGHFGDWGMDFLVRTDGDPAALVGTVRSAVAEVDPSLPVFDATTLEGLFQAQIQAPRALGLLMGVFAAVALFLSSLGIYGTLAFGVARQRPEIGIRMALGARAPTVVAGVLRRGLLLAGVGLAVGLSLAASAGAWLEDLLFGVAPIDPVTYVGISAVLGLSALLASGIPAMRASRVDPATALRGDA